MVSINRLGKKPFVAGFVKVVRECRLSWRARRSSIHAGIALEVIVKAESTNAVGQLRDRNSQRRLSSVVASASTCACVSRGTPLSRGFTKLEDHRCRGFTRDES